MKDLRILYSDSYGNRIFKEYDLVTDFTNSFVSGEISTGSWCMCWIFWESFESQKSRYFKRTLWTLCRNFEVILKMLTIFIK